MTAVGPIIAPAQPVAMATGMAMGCATAMTAARTIPIAIDQCGRAGRFKRCQAQRRQASLLSLPAESIMGISVGVSDFSSCTEIALVNLYLAA